MGIINLFVIKTFDSYMTSSKLQTLVSGPYSMPPPPGVNSKMKVVYKCHGGLKIWGFGSGPLLKIGSFQNWPTREKMGFSVKNKETYTFFKDYTDIMRKSSVAPNLELTK